MDATNAIAEELVRAVPALETGLERAEGRWGPDASCWQPTELSALRLQTGFTLAATYETLRWLLRVSDRLARAAG